MRKNIFLHPVLGTGKFMLVKTVLSILSFFLLVLLFLISCKKENITDNPQNLDKENLIAKVKSWLDNQKKDLPISDTAKIHSLKGSLVYNELRLERYKDLENFIVVPISNEFKSKNNQDKNPINYLVLILKNQDSIANGNIIQYISSNSQKVAPQNSFYKIFTNQDLDCSGQFTILSITDYFQYELKFENGRLKSLAEQRKKLLQNSNSGKVNGCIDWYWVTTFYWFDGTTTTTWDYLFTTCEDDCVLQRVVNGRSFRVNCGGGGGGGGEGIEDCINSVSGSPSSQTVNIVTTSNDGITRTKTYHWTFFSGGGGIWKFNSHETGVHKKVNNEWRWQSLTHNSVSREGFVAGGDVQCPSHVGTPTLGLYYAAMTLNYNIQASIVCKGFPFTVNNDYTSTNYFNVND